MSISACLVVFNEEKLIERCLKSIKDLVDEIILVHDGECEDKTLEIAKKYTDKIFVRDHIGIAEPHRSFSYQKASCDWILQIDADEYFDQQDIAKIRNLVEVYDIDGYNLKWEMFDGQSAITFLGLQKLCLFRKNKAAFMGLPQTAVTVKGVVRQSEVVLHHRPFYNNISWEVANKKREYWLKAHVKYFFPEIVVYECFNTTQDSWVKYTKNVRKYPLWFMIFYPLKNLIGQLKNGLWKNWLGVNLGFQQYIYYLFLYHRVWKMNRKLKLH